MHLRIALPLFAAAAAPLSAAVHSQNWSSGFTADGLIPDGNATGWFDSRAVVIPLGETIVDVDLHLSVSGGWNGDLYAYLSHPSAPGVAVLLNRSGCTPLNLLGYSDSGITVRFDDAAPDDIHYYQNTPGFAVSIADGSPWQPDGRLASPLTVTGAEPRTALLERFNGLGAGAEPWTLFVADVSTGERSTVVSWGLTITTIPEPSLSALVLSATAFLAHRRRRP